ncbi:MAG: ribonuclease HII [Acidobacteria bacterium 13_1_40CM_2_68_10]|nr:MAG: ribonuclease HII [Acidobacteria bacterium 13_1_40CM_2_68_10]OLE66052.1 MAG: ribonuclease HII [Acidobacteria bacterium 13_1_20CM_2_68_14]
MRPRAAGFVHERQLFAAGLRAVAGVDEVGRGCLAGPVVAGAVILDRSRPVAGVRDSKTLGAAARERLAREIAGRAVAFALGVVDPEEIDRTDILRATLEAMRRAVMALRVRPDFVLVDALNIPAIDVPQRGLVRGDRISVSIAAASIVAKFYRDEMMLAFHDLYPAYGFDQHKGYGTSEHLDALRRFGPTPWHRSTFRGVRQEPSFDLPFGLKAQPVN